MASNESKKGNVFYPHDDDDETVESNTSEGDNVSLDGDIKSPTSTVSTAKPDIVEQASRNKESASKGSLVSGRKGSKILKEGPGSTVADKKESTGSSVADKKESMDLETKGNIPSEEKESTVPERKGSIPSERKGSIVSERKGSNSSERKGIMFSDKNDITVTEEKSVMGPKSKGSLASEKRGSVVSERRSSGASETKSMRKKSNISRESTLSQRSIRSDTGSHISQVETRSLPLFPSQHDKDEENDDSKEIKSKRGNEPQEGIPSSTRDGDTTVSTDTLFKMFNKESKSYDSQLSMEARKNKPLSKENDQQSETNQIRQKNISNESVTSQKLHNSEGSKKIGGIASKQQISEPGVEKNVKTQDKETPTKISDEKNFEEKTGDTFNLENKPSTQPSAGEIKANRERSKSTVTISSKHEILETDSEHIAKKSPSKHTTKSRETMKGVTTTPKSEAEIGEGVPLGVSDEHKGVQNEMNDVANAADTTSKHQVSHFTDEGRVRKNTSRGSISDVDQKKETPTGYVKKMEGDNIAHEMNAIKGEDTGKEELTHDSSNNTQPPENNLVSGISNAKSDHKSIDPSTDAQQKESHVQNDTIVAVGLKTPSERKISPERDNRQTQQPLMDRNSEIEASKLSDGDDSLVTTIPKTKSKRELPPETLPKELSEFEFQKSGREIPQISENVLPKSDAMTEEVRHSKPRSESKLEVFNAAEDPTGTQKTRRTSEEGESDNTHIEKRRKMSGTRLSKDGISETQLRQASKHSGVFAAKDDKVSDASDSAKKINVSKSNRRQSKFSEALGIRANESFLDAIAQDDYSRVQSEEGASRNLPRRRSKDGSSRADQLAEPVADSARPEGKSKTSIRKESADMIPTLGASKGKSSQNITAYQSASRGASRHESLSTPQGIPSSAPTEVASDRLYSAAPEQAKGKTRRKSSEQIENDSMETSLSGGHGSEEFKKIPGTKERRSSSNRALKGSEWKAVAPTQSNKTTSHHSQDTADALEGRVILPAVSEAQRVKTKQRLLVDTARDKEGPIATTSEERGRRTTSPAQRDTEKLQTPFGTGDERRKRSQSGTGRDVETDKVYDTTSRDSGFKKGSLLKFQYTPLDSQVRRESRPYQPEVKREKPPNSSLDPNARKESRLYPQMEPDVKRQKQKSFDSDIRRESRPSSVSDAKRPREASKERRTYPSIAPDNENEKFRYSPVDMDGRKDREYRGANVSNLRRESSFHGDHDYSPHRGSVRERSPYATSVKVKPSNYPPIGSAADREGSPRLSRTRLDSALESNKSAPKPRWDGSQTESTTSGRGKVLRDFQPIKASREKSFSTPAEKLDYVDDVELEKYQRGKHRSRDNSVPTGVRMLPTSKTSEERSRRESLKGERKMEQTTGDTESSSRSSSMKDNTERTNLSRDRKSWFFKHSDYKKSSEGRHSKTDGLRSPRNSPVSDGRTPVTTPKSTSFDVPKPITRTSASDSAPYKVRASKEAETQPPISPVAASTISSVTRRSNTPSPGRTPQEGRQSLAYDAPERRAQDRRQSIPVQTPLGPEKKSQYERRQPSGARPLSDRDVPVQVPYERRGPADRPQAVTGGARKQSVTPGPYPDRRQSIAPEPSVNRKQNIAAGPTTDRRQSVAPVPGTDRRQSIAPRPATDRRQSIAPGPATERRQSIAPAPTTNRRQSTVDRRQSISPGPDRRQSIAPGASTNRRQSVSAPQRTPKKQIPQMISGQSPGDRKPISIQHAMRGQAIAAYFPSESSSISLSADLEKDAPPKHSK